jgi:hypothetical protein
MERLIQATGSVLSRRLRDLDRRLRIDHRGQSEWIWAIPLLTFVGTLAMVLVVGALIHAPEPLVAPVALILAALMTGMSVAYMTPEADSGDRGDDRGRGRSPDDVPRAPDIPSAASDGASPPPWYRRLDETVEEPAPSHGRGSRSAPPRR